MPNPNQIDPYSDRKQGVFETDAAYAKRMEVLDKRAEFFESLCSPSDNRNSELPIGLDGA